MGRRFFPAGHGLRTSHFCPLLVIIIIALNEGNKVKLSALERAWKEACAGMYPFPDLAESLAVFGPPNVCVLVQHRAITARTARRQRASTSLCSITATRLVISTTARHQLLPGSPNQLLRNCSSTALNQLLAGVSCRTCFTGSIVHLILDSRLAASPLVLVDYVSRARWCFFIPRKNTILCRSRKSTYATQGDRTRGVQEAWQLFYANGSDPLWCFSLGPFDGDPLATTARTCIKGSAPTPEHALISGI